MAYYVIQQASQANHVPLQTFHQAAGVQTVTSPQIYATAPVPAHQLIMPPLAHPGPAYQQHIPSSNDGSKPQLPGIIQVSQPQPYGSGTPTGQADNDAAPQVYQSSDTSRLV